MPHVWKRSNNSANEIHYVPTERERESYNKQSRERANDQRMKVTSRLGQNQRNTKGRVDLNDLTLNPIQTPQGGSRTKNHLYAQLR